MTIEFQRGQGERRETLDNDARVREQEKQREDSTYFEQYHEEEGGRFTKPTILVGSTPKRRSTMA